MYKYVGLVPKVAAHQRGGPRQHAVHLHLAAPEPARAGGGAGGQHVLQALGGASRGGRRRGAEPMVAVAAALQALQRARGGRFPRARSR